jgi:hypothetical protein
MPADKPDKGTGSRPAGDNIYWTAIVGAPARIFALAFRAADGD